MTKRTKDRPTPFSLRISQAEREHLSRQAGSLPLAAYIRQKLFGDDSEASFITQQFNKKSAGRVLGNLGRSEIADSLRNLAHAAHSGALPVSPETEQAIMEACAAVQDMRQDLLRALGLRPR